MASKDRRRTYNDVVKSLPGISSVRINSGTVTNTFTYIESGGSANSRVNVVQIPSSNTINLTIIDRIYLPMNLSYNGIYTSETEYSNVNITVGF